jgi:lipopolysaccharide transport system permease protein
MFISAAHLIEVFLTKLAFNLKSEASRTYLSYVWWVLEPAMMVAIFYIVFVSFLAKGTDDFIVFLICGQIPFMWFAKSISNASRSIIDGRFLINQIAIPKPFFPLLVVFQDAIKQTVVFALMFSFLLLYGLDINTAWLNVVFVIAAQFLLIIAISLAVAAITPLFPDFDYLIATAMTALMFASGVFYDYARVILPEHQKLFLMNPVASLIKNYRQVLMDDLPPDWNVLAAIGFGSVLLILLMNAFYRRFGTIYARLIIQ